MPLLTVCRLPFNIYYDIQTELGQYSSAPLNSLPTLSNTNHLRTLTIGMSTSYFLKRLLSCIPLIENLSIGVDDHDTNENDACQRTALSTIIDIHLEYLSRLYMSCLNKTSFYGAIALFSSMFGQLTHFSLEFQVYTSLFNPWIISGDTFQQLCVDQLKPSATFSVNLVFNVEDDLEEKKNFQFIFKIPFTQRQRPRAFIQERDKWRIGHNYHCFIVFTLPYNGPVLSTHLLSSNLQISSQNLVNPTNLFTHSKELFITGFIGKSCHSDLRNCRSPISSLIPWSLLTKITVDEGNVITAMELEAILRMAYNLHTLQIYDDDI